MTASASAAEARTARPRGRPPQLSHERILEVAREIPYEQMTLHALAEQLGVTPRALYRWFPSKEALFAQLRASLLSELPLPDVDPGEWRTWLYEFATSYRNFIISNPVVTEMVAPAEWPEAATIFDAVVGVITGAGFRIEDALDIYEGIVSYAYGAACFCLQRSEAPSGSSRIFLEGVRTSNDVPHLQAHLGNLANHDWDAPFFRNLRRLIWALSPVTGEL